MKRKVYIETSVISYLTSRPSKNVIEAGHQHTTYLFWDRRSEFDLVASELVLTECSAGDAMAAGKLSLISDGDVFKRRNDHAT